MSEYERGWADCKAAIVERTHMMRATLRTRIVRLLREVEPPATRLAEPAPPATAPAPKAIAPAPPKPPRKVPKDDRLHPGKQAHAVIGDIDPEC